MKTTKEEKKRFILGHGKAIASSMEKLEAGGEVSIEIDYLREKCQKLLDDLKLEELEKCPKCERLYEPGTEALSRRDNTAICPDCGEAEALEDYKKSLVK